MRLFLVAFAAFFMVTVAHAFDDEDRAGIEAAALKFEEAFNAGDWEAILPPQEMLDALGEIMDLDPGLLREQTLKGIDESMKTFELETYDIETEKMEGGTSDAGANFAFMPVRMRFSLDCGPVQEIESVVLAAELDEGWRLFRMENAQQILLFLRVYPQFEGISLQ